MGRAGRAHGLGKFNQRPTTLNIATKSHAMLWKTNQLHVYVSQQFKFNTPKASKACQVVVLVKSCFDHIILPFIFERRIYLIRTQRVYVE